MEVVGQAVAFSARIGSLNLTEEVSPAEMLDGNGIRTATISVYSLNVFVQDLLLMWRLLVLWNYKKMIWILPPILLVSEFVCALLGIIIIYKQPNAILQSNGVEPYVLAGWSIDAVFHMGVTTVISYRIWTAGQKSEMIRGSLGVMYKHTIALVVESGLLAIFCSVALIICDAAGEDPALRATAVCAQLATTITLLIVVRVGFRRYRSQRRSEVLVPSQTAAPLPALPWSTAHISPRRVDGVISINLQTRDSKVQPHSKGEIKMTDMNRSMEAV